MAAPIEVESWFPRSGRAFLLGVGMALVVLALTVFAGWLLVRSLVRQQITQRDAEALYATTLMEQVYLSEAEGQVLSDDAELGFDAAVRASRLKGVMGIRFYDADGEPWDTFPATIQPLPIGLEAFRSAQRLKAHGRYYPDTPLSDVFIYLPQFATSNIPHVATLEVTVPLLRRDEAQLAGVAQFVVEGESIGREYQRLDRHLGGLALLVFGAAGLLLAVMLWPAFRKIARLNRNLAEQNQSLQRVNQELALAARSAALGAVSAHLMHGLKNPLASLSQFVSSQKEQAPGAYGEDVRDALGATRRMQALVEQTLEVLADAQGQPTYTVTSTELLEMVRKKVSSQTEKRAVHLHVTAGTSRDLPSPTANLAGLILVNLVENAVQATPEGGTVNLAAGNAADALTFRVQDEGGGIPEHIRPKLFLPCKSSREGGSGLGLAISKQLADYLGASVELVETGTRGSVFLLKLPLTEASPKPLAPR